MEFPEDFEEEVRDLNYPEFFYSVDDRFLWGLHESDREKSSRNANRDRGTTAENLSSEAYPSLVLCDNGSEEDIDGYFNTEGETYPVQIKTNVVQHVNTYKKGRVFIPKSTIHNEELNADGFYSLLVVDYDGEWSQESELDILMEAHLPADLLSEMILENADETTGVLEIEEADGYTLRYDRVIEMVEEILNVRGESFYSVASEFYSPVKGEDAPRYNEIGENLRR